MQDFYQFTFKLPPETARHKLWRFACWLRRYGVCSWRGHIPVDVLFYCFCERCRYKLPYGKELGGWQTFWVETKKGG